MAKIYENWIPPISILALLAWTILQFHFGWYPPVGLYIATVGVVAIVVTLWPPESRWSKAAWIVIFFALGGLEVHNLYRDRAAHDKEQANARREEKESFQVIANGVTEEIFNSQRQFEASVAKLNSIASLTVEAEKTTTGGDSYCFLDFVGIIEMPGLSDHPVILSVGKYPLYDVHIRIVDFTKVNSLGLAVLPDRLIYQAEIPIGIGASPPPPNETIPFTSEIENRFNIFFIARNGVWTEELRLEKVKDRWLRALRVRGGFYNQTKPVISFERISNDFPLDKLDWVPASKIQKTH